MFYSDVLFSEFFGKVLDPHTEDAVDMVVVQRIKYDFSIPSCLDKLVCFQHAQLMRDSRLRQSENAGDIAHAKLSLKECVENPDSGGVAKHLEKLGKVIEHIFLRHFFEYLAHGVFMHV